MMKTMIQWAFLLAALLIIAACGGNSAPNKTSAHLDLGGEWSFRSDDGAFWFPAIVPGCVHTDLLSNNMIPNPYFANHEDSVQWVAKKTWEYRKTFDAEKWQKSYKNIELVFEGIDTHAAIFLNGEPLMTETLSGNTDNMFRKWQFDVSKILKEKGNELIVRFYPATDYNMSEAQKLSYSLPDERAFSRKAPYQFGWDWGPVLITCGLWKPVSLLGWNEFKIENMQIVQQSLSQDSALLSVVLAVSSDREKPVALDLKLDSIQVLTAEKFSLRKGNNIIQKNITIAKPELWHPSGLGGQKLYRITATLCDNKYMAQIDDKIGLRTVDLVREKDSIGQSFTFYVNGKPVFMKGANYIPQDNFPSRVAPERYETLLVAAKDANMNMLRIWGGGIYEDDYFYDLCDSLGILVWQDFMFACALYPGDSAFLQSVEKEAEDQVKRLRNHPCIALWCGNNEVKNGWDDWGWKNHYSKSEQQKIWTDNQKIFEKILPNVVKKHDPQRAYHASSPEWGWGHPECITEGDSHYWGVWWGEEPFEVWDAKTGRFMSEYGFQAFPDYSTIASFTLPEDRFLYSDVMKAHQKNARGYEIIHNYMEREYHVPSNFFNYVYVSQLVQSHGIGQALEIHRRKKPYCMGTLYWQLNDCWPVVSWSSIDSKYQPKALYYTAKKAFEPVILTTATENDDIVFYIVSDLQHETSGKITLQWEDFMGQIMDEKVFDTIVVPENSALEFSRLPKAIFSEYFTTSMLTLAFDDGQGNNATKIHYFDAPKNLQFPDSKLDIAVEAFENGYEITLVADALAKDLYLYTDPEIQGTFSDNYFDLRPNETKIIRFTPAKSVDPALDFRKILKTLSLKEAK